jgi:hypothetical protein
MSSATKYVCTHPAVLHYSEDYGTALRQAARHVAEAQRVGFDLGYVVQKARASYRACWKAEIKRARSDG